MAMADFFYVKLGRDILRNCRLCIRKCLKFQTWEAKMFLRKFYQQLKSHMRIFRAVFELLKFLVTNRKGWEVQKKD